MVSKNHIRKPLQSLRDNLEYRAMQVAGNILGHIGNDSILHDLALAAVRLDQPCDHLQQS